MNIDRTIVTRGWMSENDLSGMDNGEKIRSI